MYKQNFQVRKKTVQKLEYSFIVCVCVPARTCFPSLQWYSTPSFPNLLCIFTNSDVRFFKRAVGKENSRGGEDWIFGE